jgi:enoyl-[acyl-carrier protein] reductase / trans-2-enoyl-CoA reductase (NAD+)
MSMLIKPKIRGFICTASHPVGCAVSIKKQIDYVTEKGSFAGPKNVLVIGSSTGYGLASRIALAFGAGSKTIGVAFEKAAQGKRTASAGWYNTAAFEAEANKRNVYAKSFNGDAFSNELKRDVAEAIKADLGKIDCLVYSLASPRRTHPDTGETFSSVLKPLADAYTNKTIDPLTAAMKDVTLEPASLKEVEDTVTVMGGDDWYRWVDYLRELDLLTDDFTTLAYSYIGPEITYPIYTNGTIGQAKNHLQNTADKLHAELTPKGGRAYISVNKALVTQSSSAIPVVPLYMSILFKIMKAKGTNEHCIEQMHRLFSEAVNPESAAYLDNERRFRLDDLEMDADVQAQVIALWDKINADNIDEYADLKAYQDDFYNLFGFGFAEVDYDAEVDPAVAIPSITE